MCVECVADDEDDDVDDDDVLVVVLWLCDDLLEVVDPSVVGPSPQPKDDFVQVST